MISRFRITVAIVVTLVVCLKCAGPAVSVKIPVSEKVNVVLTGLDVLERDHCDQINGFQIGVLANNASLSSKGKPVLQILRDECAGIVEVKTIFSPEHGFSGNYAAGETVADDSATDGIPVISLYGKKKIPSSEDLVGLDVVVIDLQDVGSRYYTYVTTMTLMMKACAENGVKVVILDRPNPLGGLVVQGPVLEPEFSSIVGRHPIPIRHGLTIGELAGLIQSQNWDSTGKAEIEIIRMKGWRRWMKTPDTRIGWTPPSPNLPDFETALIYNGMCLLEGTNISEGRGTDKPFKTFGAPWLNGPDLAEKLNKLSLPGVIFNPIEFTPVSMPGKSKWPKYENEFCSGIGIEVTDLNSFQPLITAVYVIWLIHNDYPGDFQFLETNFIDKLYGSSSLRSFIMSGSPPEEIMAAWVGDEEVQFFSLRTDYLIYR